MFDRNRYEEWRALANELEKFIEINMEAFRIWNGVFGEWDTRMLGEFSLHHVEWSDGTAVFTTVFSGDEEKIDFPLDDFLLYAELGPDAYRDEQQRRYDAQVAEKEAQEIAGRAERAARVRQSELEQLKQLMDKYPDVVKLGSEKNALYQ